MTKPLICDLPYPDIGKFATDTRSAKIISFAYATLHGELTATLQYQYHQVWASDDSISNLYKQIAIAEMLHLDLLAKAMKQLGLDPLYRQNQQSPCTWYNTSTVSCSKTLPKMLLDDIAGEMNAIADYKKMIALLKNEDVAALIERIVLDEELHLSKLSEAYRKICDQHQ
jgi:bacterioferritin